MFPNVGLGELLIIGIVLLVVVGPDQLPSVVRKSSKMIAELRNTTTALRDDFMSNIDVENSKSPSDFLSSRSEAVSPTFDANQSAETAELEAIDSKDVGEPYIDPFEGNLDHLIEPAQMKDASEHLPETQAIVDPEDDA